MMQIKVISQIKRKRRPAPSRRKAQRRRQCAPLASTNSHATKCDHRGNSSKLTIQSLLQKHYNNFATRHPISIDMHRAAMMLQMCRTAAMGGHCNSCPDGHFDELVYNSCRHRSCPQCGWLPREQWLYGWKHRLLRCPHHHCVFTLPHDLNPIWRYNKTEFSDLLFRTCSETLQELLGDEKYLGGRVGLLCALHTWNQAALGTAEPAAEQDSEPQSWQQWCEQARLEAVGRCPVCKAILVSHSHFEPGRAPPPERIGLSTKKEAA